MWPCDRKTCIGFLGLVFSALLISLCVESNPDQTSAFRIGPDPRPGRHVYIQEGCIGCHSQYVRPGGQDAQMWGPVHSPAEILNEAPPLIGNRRQGPDLLNIGLRRSEEWLRVHLRNPQAVHEDSVMPSYAHLFQDDRGEQLIAYLSSLGREEKYRRERVAAIQRWRRDASTTAIDRDRAFRLFQNRCSACHGGSGDGNGPLASHFNSPPRNLVHEPFVYIDERSDKKIEQLERVVKFGIMGTSMPGHEYLSDEEVAGLASYVLSLRNKMVPEKRGSEKSVGEAIFLQSCAPCHGDSGRGDGILASRLKQRPRNLHDEALKFVEESSTEFEAKLRTILYEGIPGTAMPGSPHLTEPQMNEVVAFVKTLRKKSR